MSYVTALSNATKYSCNGMTNEWIGKQKECNCGGLINATFKNFPLETEESHEESVS
jgi:hypothetical protein